MFSEFWIGMYCLVSSCPIPIILKTIFKLCYFSRLIINFLLNRKKKKLFNFFYSKNRITLISIEIKHYENKQFNA